MENREKAPIGAAMPLRLLAQHRDWLVAGHRDLEIQDAFQPDFLDGDWQPKAQEARRLLEGHQGRIGIHGPFIGYSLTCGFDRMLREAVALRLTQAMDFATALGGTHMVIHSPFINFGASPFAVSTKKGPFDEQSLVHTLLDPLVEKAEKQNCTLVIENIQDTNPRPLLDLVRSFQSPKVRMSLDVGHAFITHQLGGPTPDQWVREAGDLLEHLHIQDSDGQTDRHWTPGDGNLNWHALFEALNTLEHRPRMQLELRNQEDIRRGADYLIARGFVQ